MMHMEGDVVAQYSIQQVSALLQISKDTLRYYDKLGLVSPQRGENGYRAYSGQDILDLQYVEVMKSADFSLSEIRQFFQSMRSLVSAEDCENIARLLDAKKVEYTQKIQTYQAMLAFVAEMQRVKGQIASPADLEKANALVKRIFWELRGEADEK